MKNLFRVLILALMTTAAAQASDGLMEMTATDKQNIITVPGNGRIEMMPNMAQIEIFVEAKAKTTEAAQEMNATQMRRLTGTVVSRFGLKKESIKTTGYIVFPEYEDSTRTVIGFVVRHTLTIKITQTERVGELLDVAGVSGATGIGYVQFGLSNQKDVELKALKLAVDDALVKARAIATAADRVIKRLVRVSQGNYQIIASREEGQKELQSGTHIFPEMVIVTADITAEYEF